MLANLKLTLMLAACFLATSSYALAQADADLDCSNAQSQNDMNQCASKDFDTADHELNQTYQAILSKYKDDATFIANLRKAQKAWLTFRDAELDAQYPVASGKNPRVEYGSMYPMCYFGSKTELTRQRTAQLKKLLESGPGC